MTTATKPQKTKQDAPASIQPDSIFLAKIGQPDNDHVNIVGAKGVFNVLSLSKPYEFRQGVDVHPIFGGYGTIEGLIMFLWGNRRNSNFYRQPMGSRAAKNISNEMRALALTLIHRRALKVRKHLPQLVTVGKRGIYMYTEEAFGVRLRYPALQDMPGIVAAYVRALGDDLREAGDGPLKSTHVINCIEAVANGCTVAAEIDDFVGEGNLSFLYKNLGFAADVDPTTFDVVEIK